MYQRENREKMIEFFDNKIKNQRNIINKTKENSKVNNRATGYLYGYVKSKDKFLELFPECPEGELIQNNKFLKDYIHADCCDDYLNDKEKDIRDCFDEKARGV